VAITGNEAIGITVVVTEGFGRLTMARKTFDLLGRMDGQGCSINGATQIRAGVQRPRNPCAAPGRPGQPCRGRLRRGARHRQLHPVIREPYFGHLGTVTELPPELQKLETESHARVLKVRFSDGKEAVVPRANVEMIEG
jgi:hypothetical protein